MSPPEHFTLGVLGCGKMGTAIIRGIVESNSLQHDKTNSGDVWAIQHIHISVESARSVLRLKEKFSNQASFITVHRSDNLAVCAKSDVIILGFKPRVMNDVLAAKGFKSVVQGKTLVSLLPGKDTRSTINAVVGCDIPKGSESHHGFQVVRTMPNIAAAVAASMTVVASSTEPSDQAGVEVTQWIFDHLGTTQQIPEELFDLIGSLAGCSPAFFSVAVDGLLDRSVAGGLQRSVALSMTAQTLIGLAKLLEGGYSPEGLREEASSPGGSTIQGLLEIERQGVRTAFSDALRASGERATQIGSAQTQP